MTQRNGRNTAQEQNTGKRAVPSSDVIVFAGLAITEDNNEEFTKWKEFTQIAAEYYKIDNTRQKITSENHQGSELQDIVCKLIYEICQNPTDSKIGVSTSKTKRGSRCIQRNDTKQGTVIGNNTATTDTTNDARFNSSLWNRQEPFMRAKKWSKIVNWPQETKKSSEIKGINKKLKLKPVEVFKRGIRLPRSAKWRRNSGRNATSRKLTCAFTSNVDSGSRQKDEREEKKFTDGNFIINKLWKDERIQEIASQRNSTLRNPHYKDKKVQKQRHKSQLLREKQFINKMIQSTTSARKNEIANSKNKLSLGKERTSESGELTAKILNDLEKGNKSRMKRVGKAVVVTKGCRNLNLKNKKSTIPIFEK